MKYSLDRSLSRYLARLAQFPMLEEQEENALARRYRETGDETAAHRLVTSHLRLVAKIAFGYRGYGLPVADLISEGEIGMLKAVHRFVPDRGVRLASYAKWWIRAEIQEYVLHSWSLVKLGTTAAQKKLFFNLRRVKAQLGAFEGTELSTENARRIATTLDVREADVVQMNARFSARDDSLNVGLAEDDRQWQDRLADDSESQEAVLMRRDEARQRHELLERAMVHLTAREGEIVRARRLTEKPLPFAVLAARYNVTPQRVRQIEVGAIGKLQALMKQLALNGSTPVTQRAA